MAIYLPTPGFKGKTFKLCVLTTGDFNFCVRSSPLRGFGYKVAVHINIYKRLNTFQSRACVLNHLLNQITESARNNGRNLHKSIHFFCDDATEN